MTENYIVFMEQPLKLELRKFHMLALLGKPFSGMFSWKPEENVRLAVVIISLFTLTMTLMHAGKVLCH